MLTQLARVWQACGGMRACHLLPGESFSSGSSLIFHFFLLFFFISLKLFFPFRNKFTRKPDPLPPRREAAGISSETALISPHTPKQELLGVALEGWSLSLSGGTPWWQ